MDLWRNFIGNLLTNVTAKEFFKLVNILWSYGQEFGVFFVSRCSIALGLVLYYYYFLRQRKEVARKVLLISRRAKDRRLSWPEHTVG